MLASESKELPNFPPGAMDEKLLPETVPGSATLPEKMTAPAQAASELLTEADGREFRRIDPAESAAQPPQDAGPPLALKVRGLPAVGTRDQHGPEPNLKAGSKVGGKLQRSRLPLIVAACCLAAAVLILGAT